MCTIVGAMAHDSHHHFLAVAALLGREMSAVLRSTGLTHRLWVDTDSRYSNTCDSRRLFPSPLYPVLQTRRLRRKPTG